MGSDRKSKEKSRKRSPSSPPTQDEGRHRKRHRRKQEEEDGERRKRRKEKKEHKSKSKDKHKGKHHKSMNFQELSSDDYFSKNNEFATWLKEEKKVFFSDLSSESARAMFSDFVKDWNKQKLDSRYYEGISSGPRSAHSWAIKN